VIGQILLTEPVQDCVRKVIKKMAPDARISNEEILQVISEEIIKREILDAEPAAEAKKRVSKADKIVSTRTKKTIQPDTTPAVSSDP